MTASTVTHEGRDQARAAGRLTAAQAPSVITATMLAALTPPGARVPSVPQ